MTPQPPNPQPDPLVAEIRRLLLTTEMCEEARTLILMAMEAQKSGEMPEFGKLKEH